MKLDTAILYSENIHPSVYENSKLVQLTLNCDHSTELLLHIARKSASNLETLILQGCSSQTMISLVVDNAKDPVVYLRLQKPDMESIYGYDSPVRAFKIGSPAAIFPALRHVRWHSPYMFEDDLLFRGNSDTREYLDIAFSADLTNVLERYSVFSVGRYPRLSHVSVGQKLNNTRGFLSIETYLKHIATLLSPATQILSMRGMIAYQKSIDAIFKSPSMHNVRVLEFHSTSIAFFEMLGLIKGLPRLEELNCSSKDAYPELKSVTSRMIAFVKNIYKEYYPLNSYFKLFIVSSCRSRSEKRFVLASVILAVLCPSFVYTKIASGLSLENYLPRRKTATANFSRNQHAETLECLYKQSVECLTISSD